MVWQEASASVIIPAHNESSAIGSCLRELLADAAPGEFDVVVVANGCQDDTAAVARSVAADLPGDVTVIEIPVASKTAALRKADLLARTFPRLYLDADVLCPTHTARALVTVLASGEAELAVPERDLDLRRASWAARHHYQAWSALPRVQSSLAGRGLYAFSHVGRSRFGSFPDVVADDYWAVHQVPRDVACVVSRTVTIRPPIRLADVVRVRARVYAANDNIALGRERVPLAPDLRHLLRQGRWLDLGVYVVITALAKVRARSLRTVSLAGGRDATIRGVAS